MEGSDACFFVSGTVESKDTGDRGVSVFGGDVVVSGVLYGGYDDDASATLLEMDSDLTIISSKAGSDQNEPGEDVLFFVSGAIDLKDDGSHRTVTVFNGDVVFSGSTYGGVDNESGGSTYLTQITDVLLISDKNGIDNDLVNEGSDACFFVSGTVESKDTGDRGVSVFGGDVVVSGVLYGGYDDDASATLLEMDSDLTIISSKAGSEGFEPGDDVLLFVSGATDLKDDGSHRTVTVFNGDVVVSGSLYGGVDEEDNITFLNIKNDLTVVTSEDGAENTEPGEDTIFFVSGALDSKDSGDRGTAVFGGDLVVSGVLYGGYDDEDVNGLLLEIDSDLMIISSPDGSEDVTTGEDTILFVSGAVDSKGSEDRGVAVFGGDLIVSGGIYGGVKGNTGDTLELRGDLFVYTGMETSVDDLADEGVFNSDMIFYVSGTAGDHENTATFGGDVVASGSLYVEGNGGGGLYLADLETASATSIGVDGNDKVVKVSSDRRLKKDFEPIVDALGIVNQLKGTYYVPIEKESLPVNREVGLISQEVKEIIPELTFSTKSGYGGVHYGNTVAILVEAIKDLKSEVDQLKSRLSDLETSE
jgi:hypothetical protein